MRRNGVGREKKPFYGWLMLWVAIGMAMATMPAQTVLVSLWKEPLGAELGLSDTVVSLSYSIGTIVAALPLMFVGRLADRIGLRWTVAIVSLAYCGALVLVREARGPVTLGVVFCLVRFLGQGALGMLSGHTIAMWFERRLGLAHSMLALVGFAIGSAVTPQPTAWLLAEYGWRTSLLVMSLAAFLLTLPSVLLLFRNRPEDVGQHLDGDSAEHETHDVPHGGPAPPGDPAFRVSDAIRTRAYWVLMAHSVMTGFVGTALLFHMPAMLRQAGLAGTEREAALAIQPWPITFGVVTLGVGWLADRLAPAKLLPSGLALMAVGLGTCLAASRGMVSPDMTVGLMALGMGVYGASQAVIVGVAHPTVARFFGRTHHGAIRGTIATATVMGTGGGPYAIALGRDLAGGDFTWVYVGCLALTIPLAIGAVTLRRPNPLSPRQSD